MMRILKVCGCIFALSILNTAQASVLIEPYAGYAVGTSKGSAQTSTGSDTVSGTVFGGRLGLKSMGLMAGAE